MLNLRRGAGAYALLARTDGQLTRAGQRYYSHLGLRPPTKDFDYNQPLIREGPNDYILLRNGQKKLVRSLDGDGEHRLTKLGKAFFRDKCYEYLVHVPVVIRGRRRSGRNAGAAYERKDWLPINELGGAMTLRQRMQGLRSVSFQLPCEEDVLASAFVDKPLCVARQLCFAELLQLSLEEVCADFDTMLCHDWRSLGVSVEEVRQFCVWRDAPMRFLSSQGDVVDSYDPALKRHRTVCFLCFNGHCYMYRCVKRVLERDAWRTLYLRRGAAGAAADSRVEAF